MNVTLWGTRGSLASPGPDTQRFGGNTSCVEVRGDEGTVLVLDAGTGIRRLGMSIPPTVRRIDILLTHLHMDHIQGLGFFMPLYDRSREVHIWGPASPTLGLRARLARYLSPPLFPVTLRELPCSLHIHEAPFADQEIGEFRVRSDSVIHPGPTVGYRISSARSTVTYIPDHEPALGSKHFPESPEWTSGHRLAEGADLLIHDAQYSATEYSRHVGWGHSSIKQTLQFAEQSGVGHLVPFHHEPSRDDVSLELMVSQAVREARPQFNVTTAAEGAVFELR